MTGLHVVFACQCEFIVLVGNHRIQGGLCLFFLQIIAGNTYIEFLDGLIGKSCRYLHGTVSLYILVTFTVYQLSIYAQFRYNLVSDTQSEGGDGSVSVEGLE